MNFLSQAFGLLVVSLFLSFIYYYTHDLELYMDEIFHIPQAKLYCKLEVTTWDDKITTYPGLYLVSSFIHQIFQTSCTNASLRLINIITAASFYWLLYYSYRKISASIVTDATSDLNQKIWYTNDNLIATLIALLIFIYPGNSFYYFVYYTDTMSIFWLIIVYYLVMIDNHNGNINNTWNRSQWLNSLIYLTSCMAILSRQTNAIWLLFFAGVDVLQYLHIRGLYRGKERSWHSLYTFLSTIFSFPTFFHLLDRILPLLTPIFGFICFSLYNQSIVLGDKSSHNMKLHLAMPLHAIMIVFMLMLPVLVFQQSFILIQSQKIKTTTISTNKKTMRSWFEDLFSLSTSHILWHIFGCMLVTLALVYSSHSHPFLLADNRHYMFYIWRRFLQYPLLRACLGPIYYLAILTVINQLCDNDDDGIKKNKQNITSSSSVSPSKTEVISQSTTLHHHHHHRHGPIWILGYVTAVCLSLALTPLLEPRYFAPAVTIALLNWQPLRNMKLFRPAAEKDTGVNNENPINHLTNNESLVAVIVGLLISITICTTAVVVMLYIYTFKSFIWHDGRLARFML